MFHCDMQNRLLRCLTGTIASAVDGTWIMEWRRGTGSCMLSGMWRWCIGRGWRRWGWGVWRLGREVWMRWIIRWDMLLEMWVCLASCYLFFDLTSPAPASATTPYTHLSPTSQFQTILPHPLPQSQTTPKSISSSSTSLRRWWYKLSTCCRIPQRTRPLRWRRTLHFMRIKFWVYMPRWTGTEV